MRSRRLMCLSFDKVEELVARAFVFEEYSGKCGCGGYCICFLYSSESHAGMRGLNDYSNAKRFECVLDAVAYLYGKAFLHLEAAGICFHHSGDFAEPGYGAVRYVCDMCLAYERHHMVLACRV